MGQSNADVACGLSNMQEPRAKGKSVHFAYKHTHLFMADNFGEYVHGVGMNVYGHGQISFSRAYRAEKCGANLLGSKPLRLWKTI